MTVGAGVCKTGVKHTGGGSGDTISQSICRELKEPNQLTSVNRYHVIYHVLCPAEDLLHFCHLLEHY